MKMTGRKCKRRWNLQQYHKTTILINIPGRIIDPAFLFRASRDISNEAPGYHILNIAVIHEAVIYRNFYTTETYSSVALQ